MFAVPYPSSFYEPHNGVYPDMTPPSSLEKRFPDVDAPLPVCILVSPYPHPTEPSPRDRQWSLAWSLPVRLSPPSSPSHRRSSTAHAPTAVARVLETRQEPGRAHFTFWGPITRARVPTEMHGARWVPVAVLGRKERRELERIAGMVRVMKPNGWWNGQNWIVALLNAAVEEDVIAPEQRDSAIWAAAMP
ncbi:hypothetical protein OF83DRAFT_1157057 [Amylostereum chailletii]|nr:hypothetical protein OF83DRAFT_1157057 [Amylostereum chailletii]